jgi:uncharacterized protein YbjT (DUF2867 family)
MHADDLILVTGATGNTGSAVLQQLDARGARVRALVRGKPDKARLGDTSATMVVGNFDNPRSLEAALEGVTRAYLVTPSSPEAEAQQIRFAELAAAAGVTHLVKLSQLAADEASPVRFLRYHAAVERRIRELGVGFTFLRSNLYFQGLLAFQPLIAKEGRFVAPIGDARVSAVDVRDIAAVAAVALTERGHEGKTYTIMGPAAVTHTRWPVPSRRPSGAMWHLSTCHHRRLRARWKPQVCRAGKSRAWSRTPRITRVAKPRQSLRTSVT